ncbi:glutamate--tRNA ligase [Candidatus Phycosocius spiralis]|uniref:Glutamate--tRNA ligase n=1 Tax=Candidatus Phycosocius spiralis TaxID=2815099 RepID=A0ABQ4PWR9_9PROT|nr:glutamate--tRNA ligase [Candidatus Phycosocius spiralis]GIU67450.1 glutamate--tRNA ligase 1 [Candidatus Phycosocius spiralis]
MKVRFAPSPTGKLHVGNVITALRNWLFARQKGGSFLLRIDDTDTARSTKAYENGIFTDLTWLGLNWDELARQSERYGIYDQARDKLIAAGLLYPCYETEEELDRKRKIALSRKFPPIYDRAALSQSQAERAEFEKQGRKPHWRFKLSGKRVAWQDLIRGSQTVDTSSMSDPILIREDGAYLYTLPSVVDDVDLGVTHVIRGEDHVTNTGAQAEIFEALTGGLRPEFGHFPLLVGADGETLSKRIGSLSVESLRDQGVAPLAVLSLMARIGTSDPVEAVESLDALVAGFDCSKIGRAPARFDPQDVKRIDAQLLQMSSYTSIKHRLAALGCDLGEAFWLAVRGNLTRFDDVLTWAKVVEGPIEPHIEDLAFAETALRLLPSGPFDETSWSSFIEAVKLKTGAKGKSLFMPLRKALTGLDHGPEMNNLFVLIGHDRAAKRLAGQIG